MNINVDKIRALHEIADDIRKKFLGLFPAWPTILATALALTVLTVVLTKLVWKPVKRMIQERRNFIKQNIDQARSQNIDAEKNRELALNELNNSRHEASMIIAKAKSNAHKIMEDNVEETRQKIDHMMKTAKEEIEKEKQKFELEARNEIIEVALAAASKVIQKNVDSDVNRKLIQDFIASKEKN